MSSRDTPSILPSYVPVRCAVSLSFEAVGDGEEETVTFHAHGLENCAVDSVFQTTAQIRARVCSRFIVY